MSLNLDQESRSHKKQIRISTKHINMYIQIAALSINMKYVQDVLYENISPVYNQNAA